MNHETNGCILPLQTDKASQAVEVKYFINDEGLMTAEVYDTQ
jgi:hypothetical protein